MTGTFFRKSVRYTSKERRFHVQDADTACHATMKSIFLIASSSIILQKA